MSCVWALQFVHVHWGCCEAKINAIRDNYSKGIFSNQFSGSQLITETLIVPNTQPKKVSTSFATKVGAVYIIEASGYVSDWSDKSDGVDAVWCYAKWRCGENGEPWQQLRIDGKGMIESTGRHIPYNPKHIYCIEIPGTGAPFVFHMLDAQNSAGDNSGSIKVAVTEKR